MLVDFSRIWVQMCCVGNDRVNDLYAAAFNILMNTSRARVTVMFNDENMTEESKERRKLLQAMAEVNDSYLVWKIFPKEVSKAQMIESVIKDDDATLSQYLRREWVLNVDDDYMIPTSTLVMLSSCSDDVEVYSKFEMLMYGQFDIINYKGHKDWSNEKLSKRDLFMHVFKYGLRLLPHHVMDHKELTEQDVTHPTIFRMPGQSTGSHMFKIKEYMNNEEIRRAMKNWKKGKRGYDDMLCNNIGRVGWIMGSNSYHTDRTKAHLDGKLWTEAEDVKRDNMRVKRPRGITKF